MRKEKGNMKNRLAHTSRVSYFSFFIFSFLFLTSCNSPLQSIPDRTDSAVQEISAARVRRSEGGRLQLELDAPVIQKYESPKAVTVFRSRSGVQVKIRFFDANDGHMTASIHADSAISFDDRDKMEAYGNVRVIDYKTNDTVYLQDLIWEGTEDRAYSEHPVLARNGRRVTEGDGFTSDGSMENLQITHQRGVIEFNDD
jgi:LPS export ABC transporter protein LptC